MSLATQIWKIFTPAQRRSLLVMQLMSLLVGVCTATGIASIAPFFAVLGDPTLIQRNPWLHGLYAAGGFSDRRSFILALGAGFVAIVLLANLLSVLGALAASRLAQRIGRDLQTALFGEYLTRPYAFHAATHSSRLLNNVVYETDRLTHGILENVFVLVTNLVTTVLIITSIMILKTAVALLMLAALAGGYLLIYLAVRKRLLDMGDTHSRLTGEQTQIVTESFGAIREIILLQAQEYFRGRFARNSGEILRTTAHTQLIGQIPRHFMECVAAAGLVSVALLLGFRQGGLGLWLGPLTFLAFAAYRLLPALQQVFAAVVRIRADRAVLHRIGPDLLRAHNARRMSAEVASASDTAWRERPRCEIQLKDVSYRHAADRSWALREVSLRIAARSTVGIVGANGSGKSTLADVIAGLLTPATGSVEIDGCVLQESNRTAWQARIGYVPQSVFLLDASVAQNIALGAGDHAIDRARLREAARLAQLEDLVRSLPQGFMQGVGERGVALSGGQRQRIGIARALYRDVSLLLLDEATTALDGLTEEELIATLERLRGRCTIVLIAHRINTLRVCDVIYELDRGTISGSGSYQALRDGSHLFRQSRADGQVGREWATTGA
ncbi:MAG: ABC transporter ATP-binding protein [Proteobacteria bacterium]|nr:ABC transporter ATP-binding protein [Pseudomonadota bacterium]